MTGILMLFVIILLSIAVWQLIKIFDLTQIDQSVEDSQVATEYDNKVNGYLMFAFLGFIYIFTIYSLYKWGPLVLGKPASEHGPEYDTLMAISMWLIFIVQTVTQALLHYFAFKYRGRKNQKALYFSDNNKLEFIWSSIPAIVLAVLIFYGLYAWTDIMFVDEEEDVMVVELYAKQFGWEVRYSGKDNVLGKANVRYIEGTNTLGVDMSDPNAQDDIVASELHLPKGKRVMFKIRSQDVLHSAYMPHFRAQMNCVPGMVTEFAFTPIFTTQEMRDQPFMQEKVANINAIRTKKSVELVAKGETALDPYTFDYLLLCNKICGASHYNMQMKIVVDTPEEYKKWVASKPTFKEELKAATAAPATDANAKESDTTTVPSDKMVAQVVK